MGFQRALAYGLAGGLGGFGEALAAQAEKEREDALRAQERADRTAEIEADRTFRREMQTEDQQFRSSESELDREFRATEAAKNRADKPPSKRDIRTDQNGVDRYTDTGEPVFPDVQTAPKPGFRVAAPEEAAKYGAKAGQIDEKTGRFYPAKVESNMVLETDENGNLTFAQGPGVDATQIGKAGQNKIDTEQIDSQKTLGRLDQIDENLKNPEVLESLTASGALKRFGLEWKDYLSPDSLTDEQREYLYKVTQARSDVLTNVNFTIKEITGAAMGVQEAQRIIATLPNVNDSPTMFVAKLESALNRTRMAIARYNMWRSKGLSGRPEEFDTLPNIEKRVENRRRELMEAVDAGKMTAEEASSAFASEFGI